MRPSRRFLKYSPPTNDERAATEFMRVVRARSSSQRSLSPSALGARRRSPSAASASASASPPTARAPSIVQRARAEISAAGVDLEPSAAGRGGYATVYRGVARDPRGIALLMSRARDRVGDASSVPRGADVAVKIQAVAPEEVRDVEREARVHAYVSARAPSLTPRLYAAGRLACGAYVTLMAFVPGETLCSMLPLRAPQFLAIERLVAALWRLRVFHADLHCNNIIFERRARRFRVIDFGRAIVLPAALAPRTVAQAVRPSTQRLLQDYADAVVASRARTSRGHGYAVLDRTYFAPLDGLAQYAGNVHALRTLFAGLPPRERERLRPGRSATGGARTRRPPPSQTKSR